MRRLPPLVLLAALAFSGCRPQQPFYFFEDGDLSHYKGVATEIEYPDLEEQPLGEVEGAVRPFSLDNKEVKEVWELSLEEAVQIALKNNKVMRNIGGQIVGAPEFILRNFEGVPTIYDPAMVESNPRAGVEAALSAFDTQLRALTRFERFDEPRNTTIFGELIFPQVRHDDVETFQVQLRKVNATGGSLSVEHDVIYDDSNNPLRLYRTDWTTQLRLEARQPLLQGGGVQFNRIAGPGAIPGVNTGVMIARVNNDIALADFEANVRNLVSDVEVAYWELYYAYRGLDAVKKGRDAGLETWRQVHAKFLAEVVPIHEDAQARQQYFEFRAAMERALTSLYQTESKLRYMMGLATTDGRLIQPKDEPVTAKVTFDWYQSHAEALARSTEIREQRWRVKQRELELIAAKNYLLPRLDLTAMYQWNGLGNALLASQGGTGNPFVVGSNSYQSLTHDDFQNWQLGLEFNMPLGFRKEMAGVRNAQMAIARDRARLQEGELELSHQLAFAIREMESAHVLCQTNYNRRVASRVEVEAAIARYWAGVSQGVTPGSRQGGTLADVLDAQRRQAVAEADYYRSLVDYNEAIMRIHLRKGSLLEYNGVFLAEGPWPAKAYFDACRRARARDASLYLDYGFTQPKVLSRGPYEQHAGQGTAMFDGPPEAGRPAGTTTPEAIPAPEPEPLVPEVLSSPDPEPAAPKPVPEPQAGGPAIQKSPLAGSWRSVKQAAGPAARKPRDLGALDLGSLAGKGTSEQGEADGRWTAVKPASHEVPKAAAEAPKGSRRTTTTTKSLKWVDSTRSAASHEPDSNAPPAETDRTPSGWKGLER